MLPQRQLLDLGLAPDMASLRRQLVAAAEALGFGLVAAVLVRGDLASGRAWLRKIGNTPAAYEDAQNCLDDTLRDPVTMCRFAWPLARRRAKSVKAAALTKSDTLSVLTATAVPAFVSARAITQPPAGGRRSQTANSGP